MYFGCILSKYVRPTQLISTQNVGLYRNHISYNEHITHKQNLYNHEQTSKHNLSFNADSQKWLILINLKTIKGQIYDLGLIIVSCGSTLRTVNIIVGAMFNFTVTL